MNAIRHSFIVATLLIATSAAMLIANAWIAPLDASAHERQPRATASTPMVAVATGERVNGVAVFRLPSINVSITRSAALAEIERESASANATSVRLTAGHAVEPVAVTR